MKTILLLCTSLLLMACSGARYGHLMRSSKASPKPQIETGKIAQTSAEIDIPIRQRTPKISTEAVQNRPVGEPLEFIPSQMVGHSSTVTSSISTEKGLSSSRQDDAKHRMQTSKATQKVEKIRSKGNAKFYGLFGAYFALLSSFLLAGKKRARKIAEWAKKHKRSAQALLVGSKIALAVGGFELGVLLANQHVVIDRSVFWLLGGLTALTTLVYPIKRMKRGLWKQHFLRRKLLDLSLVTIGAFSLFAGGNILANQAMHPSTHHQTVVTKLIGQERLEKAHQWVSPTESSPTESHRREDLIVNIVLTILLLAAAGALGYGIAIWSCNLSCSGYEVFAWIVLIGGWGGTILLSIHSIRTLWKKPKPIEEPVTN